MTKRAFGELELAILQIMRSEERKTVKEVQQLLGGHDKYTTVMTVMNRLTEKNQLERERIGLQYEYWMPPTSGKTRTFLEQFKKKILGFNTTSMVSFLIESADDITEEDLVKMEKMIEQAKARRKK